MRENLIKVRSFEFALSAISLYMRLLKNNEFVLSKQFLRSATSIGANVEEALAAHSRKDFIFKMGISSKEARETNYWLRLLQASQIIEYPFDDLINKSESLINILTTIVKTAKENER